MVSPLGGGLDDAPRGGGRTRRAAGQEPEGGRTEKSARQDPEDQGSRIKDKDQGLRTRINDQGSKIKDKDQR